MSGTSDEQELARKVDALLKRHAPAVEDRNLPVLNEIIEAPAWTPPPGVELSASGKFKAFVEPLPAGFSAAEAEALALRIFDQVYAKVEAELSTRFEERITERLAAQVTASVQHVLADLKPEIANVIGDAIHAALVKKTPR